MSEQQRKNSLLRSSISINSIRRTASQFTKSLERSNIIAKDIIKTTKDRIYLKENFQKINSQFQKITADGYIVVKWVDIPGQWHYTEEQAKRLEIINEMD